MNKLLPQRGRPGWHDYFLNIAESVSERATCPRLAVGALFVSPDNHILASGYNGSPKGMPHCCDVGCLIIDNHCVPGDTVISKFQTGYYNTGHRTIKQIFDQWQDPLKRGALRRMKIRSVTPEGMIVPDRITDVWLAGTKQVYRLTTQVGRTVRATPDHRILTPDGWKALESIAIGDKVALNGLALYDDVVFDAVVSIEPAGVEDVYDLTTEKYHNFVADGVVVHNCVRVLHAERNAILMAAKHGVRLEGATCYCSHSSCAECMLHLIQVGIKVIYYRYEYTNSLAEEFAKEAGISLIHVPSIT